MSENLEYGGRLQYNLPFLANAYPQISWSEKAVDSRIGRTNMTIVMDMANAANILTSKMGDH